LHGSIPRLDRVNPTVPASLAAIITKCLSRKPEDRYPDMRSLIDALQNPGQADLAILDQDDGSQPDYEFFQVLKYVGIGLLILVGVILMAIFLQTWFG